MVMSGTLFLFHYIIILYFYFNIFVLLHSHRCLLLLEYSCYRTVDDQMLYLMIDNYLIV